MFGCYNLFHYLCIVHTHASGRNGWNSDILESVIDALFLAIWNFHNTDKPVKSNSGDECYGCSIYSRSVPRANYALTHTFRGALYTDRRGYSDSVRSLVGLWKASDSGTSRWGYPAFCMPSSVTKNPLAHGYQSEQHVADRCQIISQLIYLEEDLQEGFSPNHSWNGLAERLICLKY